MTATIRSPLPGVFYRRPNPGAPPFVKEGDRVDRGDTIGLVEVMKQFVPVKADVSGVVKRFLVEDAGEVEAGQAVVELE